jgi:hypothetical protein
MTNNMARPCKIDTVNFFRRLKDDERAILLAAGAGDLSEGFRNLLAIYAALHNAGFRPGDSLERISIFANANHSHLD